MNKKIYEKPFLNLFALFFMLINSCNQVERPVYDDELKDVLRNSRDNEELLKVLRHYSLEKHDSLKLKATIHLISNMSLHYSYVDKKSSNSEYDEMFNATDSLIKSAYFNPYRRHIVKHIKDSIKNDFRTKLLAIPRNSYEPLIIADDLTSMKAKWLISHVDNAFIVWRSSRFAKQLSFQQFLEELLPYRARYESVNYESPRLKKLLYTILDPEHSPNIEDIVDKFNLYASNMDLVSKTDRNLGDLGFNNILQFKKFECSIHSEWTSHALNACGIPTAYDFTPSWLNRNRHHYWVAVRSLDGTYKPFTPLWQQLNDKIYFDETSKVYRRRFTKQENPYTLSDTLDEVPEIFNDPFIKDVSQEYHETVDITLPDPQYEDKTNLSYLAIFSASGWKPVGWGIVNKRAKTVTFKNVPVNIVYMYGKFKNGNIEPSDNPFYLKADGTIHFIHPDSNKYAQLHLVRKFHEKIPLLEKMELLNGAVIQGSKTRDFKRADEIYKLRINDISEMSAKFIELPPSKNKFKFIRILSKSDTLLDLATFELYSNKPTPEKNKPLRDMLEQRYRLELKSMGDTSTYSNLFDANEESYVSRRIFMFEQSKSLPITGINISPRNSNNSVVRGDRYELRYFLDKKWVTAGTKIAKRNYLNFYNVPAGTLYWLRNLDHGKEEQAFLYINGRQIFINETNYINNKFIPFSEIMQNVYLSPKSAFR